MKKFFILLLLFVSGLFLSSCNSSGNSTGSSNFSLSSPVVEAVLAIQGGSSQPAAVAILTTSSAVTNAGITVTGNGLTLPVTYTTALTTSYQGNQVNEASYNSGPWTNIPGQAYTITVSMMGSTHSSAITSVGGIAFNNGASGVTATWTGGVSNSSSNPLNVTTAQALETTSPNNMYTYPSNLQPPYLTSPFIISASSLSGHTSNNYVIQVNCNTTLTSAFPGTNAGSFVTSSDQELTTY